MHIWREGENQRGNYLELSNIGDDIPPRNKPKQTQTLSARGRKLSLICGSVIFIRQNVMVKSNCRRHHTLLVIGHKEINLQLTRKLPPCWLGLKH